MFPLFLNLTGRLAVVVGGGPVGQRKARALLDSGCRVRVVCLEPRPAELISPHLEWLTEPYAVHHLQGATLAFAAASADVNRQVAADARACGLWVNVADDPQAGDFFVPATFRRGQLTIAIGTGGAAPGLAREIRAFLESQVDESFGPWVELLAELRPQVLARVADAQQRQALFERLCRWEWLDRLRQHGPDSVRRAMLAEVQAVAGTSDAGI